MITDEKKKVYELKDGDIPCTPEKEPNYNYVFNFCGDVTEASFPKAVCSDVQMGSAIQYIDRSDGYKECNVIGHYDPERDDTFYALIDPQDPSKGVAITYLYGQKCPSGKLRSATINVECANVKFVEDSANEPSECAYTVTMRSMYGCPKVRSVTDSVGRRSLFVSCLAAFTEIISSLCVYTGVSDYLGGPVQQPRALRVRRQGEVRALLLQQGSVTSPVVLLKLFACAAVTFFNLHLMLGYGFLR
jgi:hypothetical protein